MNRRLSLLCTVAGLGLFVAGCQKDAARSSATNTNAESSTAGMNSHQTGQTQKPGNSQIASPSKKPAVAGNGTIRSQQPSGGTLGIGDDAPPIAIANWMTGDEVEEFEDGTVYVVEFWATWCPPCRTSMPHLSDLSQKYGDDVKFIGVTRENESTVETFLEKEQSEGKTWREVVKYRLALDEGGATNAAYMKAAGQSGIPTAFIVGRDQKIEWIGHPMSMDASLAGVVDGTFDRAKAIAEFKQKQQMKTISRELGSLVRNKKFDEALEKIDAYEEEFGPSNSLTTFKLAVLKLAGKTDEIAALQPKVVENQWDDAQALKEIAWQIATSQEESRDLDLALKAARRSSELTDDKNAATLDTVARVYYESGNLKEAVAWQKKAVKHGASNKSIKQTLEDYENELAEGGNDKQKPEASAN